MIKIATMASQVYKFYTFRSLKMRILTVLLLFLGLNLPLYSGAELSNIRTSFEKGKQRIVIDLDGNSEPAYYIRKGKETIDITIESSTTIDKAKGYAELLANTNFVKKATFIVLPEEDEIIISMSMNEKVADDIFALGSPSRIVVDLEKAKGESL